MWYKIKIAKISKAVLKLNTKDSNQLLTNGLPQKTLPEANLVELQPTMRNNNVFIAGNIYNLNAKWLQTVLAKPVIRYALLVQTSCLDKVV